MLRYILLLFLVLNISLSGIGQTILNKKGDKAYSKFNYKKAIEYYEESKAIDSSNMNVLRCLADSYDKIGDYEKAKSVFSLLMSNSKHTDSDLLNYAVYKNKIGEHEESIECLKKYLAKNDGDVQATRLLTDLQKHLTESLIDLRGSVVAMDINSEYSEFAPVIFDNKLVFTSGRKVANRNERRYGWDDQFFLELFECNLSKETLTVELFAKEIRSRYHEGVVCFSNENQTMYITRNNYVNGKLVRSKDGVSNLKIYISNFKNGKWDELEEFAFNNSEYSVGHPTITADGKIMYFVSDMPGGFGGTDIYSCRFVNGNWSSPENLGDNVNSALDEMFPFVTKEGNLFFSSNGHAGLGGQDLYGLNLNIPDSKIIHLAAPINSVADDFSIAFRGSEGKGYFASNRKGGLGLDDLYEFEIEKLNKVNVHVKDSLGEINITADKIKLLALDHFPLDSISKTSEFSFKVNGGSPFHVTVEKIGYRTLDTLLFSYLLEPEKTHILKMNLLPVLPEESVNFVFKDFDTGNLLKPDVFQIIEPYVFDLKPGFGSGDYLIDLEKGIDYRFFAKKDGFYALDFNYRLGQDSIVNKKEFAMQPISQEEKMKELLPEDLATVYFDFDKAIVKESEYVDINKVIDIMQKHKTLSVTLVARADTQGSSIYNQQLANKRALATKDFFLKSGIKPERVVILALGDTSPFEKKKGQTLMEWYQMNRCVDFQLNTVLEEVKKP